jgi:hypothetical protein
MSMPTTREDQFLKLFLSAYEEGSWADSDFEKPDSTDRTNPAVDQIAKRKSDGKTLAIEHTIIEPFVKEKHDFASFDRSDFLSIEQDTTLLSPGIWIQVFVPVGTLQGQQNKQDAIVQSVKKWLKDNLQKFVKGTAKHTCPISVDGKETANITLTVKVTSLLRGLSAKSGLLHVRRQQVENSLGEVIEKALRKKLPKLVNTPADKRILLLERQHMNLLPESILAEIEARRSKFPELEKVDEIWIIETILFDTKFGETYLLFELYKKGEIAHSYAFNDGKLLTV